MSYITERQLREEFEDRMEDVADTLQYLPPFEWIECEDNGMFVVLASITANA